MNHTGVYEIIDCSEDMGVRFDRSRPKSARSHVPNIEERSPEADHLTGTETEGGKYQQRQPSYEGHDETGDGLTHSRTPRTWDTTNRLGSTTAGHRPGGGHERGTSGMRTGYNGDLHEAWYTRIR